jgi:hypothetical protein
MLGSGSLNGSMARFGVPCRDSGRERNPHDVPVRGTVTGWKSQWLGAPHRDGETDVLPIKIGTS